MFRTEIVDHRTHRQAIVKLNQMLDQWLPLSKVTSFKPIKVALLQSVWAEDLGEGLAFGPVAGLNSRECRKSRKQLWCMIARNIKSSNPAITEI